MALGEFFTSDQMKLKHFTKIKMFINSGQWSIAYMAFHLIVGYTESVSHFTNKKKKCLIYSGKPSNESMLPMHQIVMLHSHCWNKSPAFVSNWQSHNTWPKFSLVPWSIKIYLSVLVIESKLIKYFTLKYSSSKTLETPTIFQEQ